MIKEKCVTDGLQILACFLLLLCRLHSQSGEVVWCQGLGREEVGMIKREKIGNEYDGICCIGRAQLCSIAVGQGYAIYVRMCECWCVDLPTHSGCLCVSPFPLHSFGLLHSKEHTRFWGEWPIGPLNCFFHRDP